MADWVEWSRVVPDLIVGGAGGALGAVARDLGNSNRQLSWVLVLDVCCAVPLGMAAVTGASALGDDDPRGQVAIAITVGLLGKAAIVDIVRGVIRSRMPPGPPATPDA
jgi:hypothetical protein